MRDLVDVARSRAASADVDEVLRGEFAALADALERRYEPWVNRAAPDYGYDGRTEFTRSFPGRNVTELVAEARAAVARISPRRHDALFRYRGGVMGRGAEQILADLADAVEHDLGAAAVAVHGAQ